MDLLPSHTNSSVDYDQKLFIGYSPSLLIFASVACIIFILVGVPGNFITIIALSRCKKVRNATAVFIINLSLADFFFSCFNLPLQASTFWNRQWKHGDLLCHLFPLLRYGLLAVSLFTILAITINRYVMIGHPRIYPRIYRRKYLAIMVAMTWICAFGSLIPTWRGVWGKFGLDVSIGSCSILADTRDNSPKEFLFIMAFALPCFSIICCYARIFYIVRKTAMRTQDNKFSGSTRIPQIKTDDNNKHLNSSSPKQKIQLTNNIEANQINENNKIILNEEKQLLDQNHQNDLYNHHHHHDQQIKNMDINLENGLKCNNDLELSRINSQYNPRKFLSKLTNTDDLKFIDTSFESENTPTQGRNLKTSYSNTNLYPNGDDQQLNSFALTLSDQNKKSNLSSNSINKTVEFVNENNYDNNLDDNNKKKLFNKNINNNNFGSQREIDSACEVSTTSSSDNNQVYNINNTNNQLQQPVQIDPSSSSGIDIPQEENSPKNEKRPFTQSVIRRSTRFKRKTKKSDVLRKLSTAASGASIIYPGRMSSKDRRLLKMILVIFMSFLICYLPITITKIFSEMKNYHTLNIMGYLLIYLTTCINPIIYVVMSSEYRQAYRNLLLCKFSSRGSGNDDVKYKGSQRT